MIVAVGSTRQPKVEAVRVALERIGGETGWPEGPAQVIPRDVSGSAPSMPVSAEELMAGAEARARSLRFELAGRGQRADYYVGLEGGFNVLATPRGARLVFLESWVHVAGEKRGFFARGPGIAVPEPLAAEVLDRGVELGEAIDAFSGRRDVRSEMGTWGILTRGLLSRRDSFVSALIAAFAPFYNAPAYSGGVESDTRSP